jgi:hypothetical protein
VTRRTSRLLLAAAGLAASSTWLVAGGVTRSATGFRPPKEIRVATPWPLPPVRAQAARDEALARAIVWRRSQPASFDFSANPPDPTGQLSRPLVECRFLAKAATGTTPKFDCVLSNGEVVKVKYGRNPENHAEAASTRLLTALGFGADSVYLIPRLRCHGCPRYPFHTMRLLDVLHAGSAWERHTADTFYTDFEWVSLERRLSGHPIEVDGDSGWAWFELPREPSPAGEQREHLDAFRLMAVFLAHWDNKRANQRLQCLTPLDGNGAPPSPAHRCPEPMAIIQDGGATFGPRKVDVDQWREVRVWDDRASCRVSLRALPWGGGTFVDAQISEGGRRLLAAQLGSLTEHQIRDLFRWARFAEFEAGRWFGPSATVDAWVSAFREKVRQISEAGPCPL